VPSGGGSQVSVFSAQNFELTRLQSDTNLIAANVSVAAGAYTAVKVTVAAPYGVFINSSGATVGTCAAGKVCNITGSAATITYTFTPPLSLAANSNQWLNLDFNYNNAIVTTTGSIDVTQSGVMTSSSTVPTGVPSGDVANIDDFTGAVTAISASSITLKSTVRGSLTASISSTTPVTPVFDPQSQCTGGGSLFSCIKVGSVVSLQGILTNAGVVNATSIDLIDSSPIPADEVEGIVYPSNCNGGSNYGLILSDSAISTSNSPLASAKFGAGVCLTLNPAATFAIDTGILTGQPGVPISNAGFSGTGDIFTGQMVRAKVTGAATGTNGINVTATALILRFSRLTGTVNTVIGSNTFTLSGLPAYLGTIFVVPPAVETYTNATLLEGTTSVTVGQTVSISALYLNPTVPQPFQAAKVRVP